jgi:hypothetical protein
VLQATNLNQQIEMSEIGSISNNGILSDAAGLPPKNQDVNREGYTSRVAASHRSPDLELKLASKMATSKRIFRSQLVCFSRLFLMCCHIPTCVALPAGPNALLDYGYIDHVSVEQRKGTPLRSCS